MKFSSLITGNLFIRGREVNYVYVKTSFDKAKIILSIASEGWDILLSSKERTIDQSEEVVKVKIELVRQPEEQ